jgi:ribulose bisphosphate carboxylase small subunit
VGQQEADVTTERMVMLPLSRAEAWKLVELIELADEEKLIFDRETIRDIYAGLRRRLISVDPKRDWRVL